MPPVCWKGYGTTVSWRFKMKFDSETCPPFDPDSLPLFREFATLLRQGSSRHLLRNDIVLGFEEFLQEKGEAIPEPETVDGLKRQVACIQELLLFEDEVIFQYRSGPGTYDFFSVHDSTGELHPVTPEGFLDSREHLVGVDPVATEKKLKLDFRAFYTEGPFVEAPEKIGQGQKIVNDYVASKLNGDAGKWRNALARFLGARTLEGKPVLVDGSVTADAATLAAKVRQAVEALQALPRDTPLDSILPALRQWGLLEGFGNSPAAVIENLTLLLKVLGTPTPDQLEAFLSRLPLNSRVAVISPHGWFGQKDVLGRPDTGGQIVYILDQVKALEKHLVAMFREAGVTATPKIIVLTRLIPESEGTTCHERLEKIDGTENSFILRVPFMDDAGNIMTHWIPRFKVWPYLERFALDSREELNAEFGGKPDLIIGNYSDGNLVGALLASWMNVMQANIAHALEKSKYLFSALYWKDMEQDYRFSLQFTADLMTMNRADIIISSTAQEVAGTPRVVGQYESYSLYSMPELYQVTGGINLAHPKFNVLSPGVDESIYFPHQEKERRAVFDSEALARRLFEDEGEGIYGRLERPDLRPIFTMARLDKIKNLTGLVEAYGQDTALQQVANLIVVTRTLREERVTDHEEMQELKKMYQLIEGYNLHGKMRWVENTSRETGAEFYRIVADHGGVFVQPALFEAFGLTVLESMVSGLPTFATQFGGPMETIQDGVNGFWINPTQPERVSGPILDFFNKCRGDKGHWQKLSQAGIDRVNSSYTWRLYSKKLIRAANLYRLWNFAEHGKDKRKMDQYCDLIFHRIFKDRLKEF